VIDRGPADIAAKRPPLLVQIRRHGRREHVDAPQRVAWRDYLVEADLIERLGR